MLLLSCRKFNSPFIYYLINIKLLIKTCMILRYSIVFAIDPGRLESTALGRVELKIFQKSKSLLFSMINNND